MKKINIFGTMIGLAYVVVYAVMFVLALLSIIGMVLLGKDSGLYILSNAVLGAVIGAALIDVTLDIISRKAKDDETARAINDALLPTDFREDSKPRLYELYNSEAKGIMLKNAIKSYCGNHALANGYFTYIDSSFRAIRYNEDYNVEVFRKASGSTTQTFIHQDLLDTFSFPDQKKLFIRVLFTFPKTDDMGRSPNELDKSLSIQDKHYMMREELPDANFVTNSIIAPARESKWNDIVKNLQFKLKLLDYTTNKEVTLKVGEMVFALLEESSTPYALEISAEISDRSRFVSPDTGDFSFFPEEKHIRQTFRVSFTYPVPDSFNTFYAVYSQPAVSPKFTLGFDGVKPRAVKSMTFLSFNRPATSDEERLEDGSVKCRIGVYIFDTSRMIFPRSGISFSWDLSDSE